MHKENNKLYTEKRTVEVMITMYCTAHHTENNKELCFGCTNLLKYETLRIDKCVYGVSKPTCEKCPIHCYNKLSQEEIKKIMRYAGPKMIFRHPILSIKHLLRKLDSKTIKSK